MCFFNGKHTSIHFTIYMVCIIYFGKIFVIFVVLYNLFWDDFGYFALPQNKSNSKQLILTNSIEKW